MTKKLRQVILIYFHQPIRQNIFSITLFFLFLMFTYLSFYISISLYLYFSLYIYLSTSTTCKTWYFGNTSLCLRFFIVKGIYTCKIGHVVNKTLRLCLFWCTGNVHIYDSVFCQRDLLYMFIGLYRICTHMRLRILSRRLIFHVCVF